MAPCPRALGLRLADRAVRPTGLARMPDVPHRGRDRPCRQPRGGSLMAWWRAVAGELVDARHACASIPLGLLVRDGFDPTAPHPTSVVLVHASAVRGRTSSFCEASSRVVASGTS